MAEKLKKDRLTLVPLRVYTKARRIKVALGIARGKKQYEKRDQLKQRDVHRELQRSLKSY